MDLGYAWAVIGQDTLDRIRRETDLVALIGESLKLVKRGRSFVGLCPFHKEKSPSFHVNPERGFYHCFGCHASGDALKFVQESEGLEFLDAVRRLAERAGIEVDFRVSEGERQQQLEARRRADEHYEVSAIAASWFERMLREHPLAAYAQAELERRGLVPSAPTDSIADTLQAFRVGYAPFGWEGLAQHLRDQRASLSAAERVGLVAPRKTGGGFYDRFRHRLMFAVVDVQGRVIAFSGRALSEPPAAELTPLGLSPSPANADKPAKYYNSPESPIYKKREALFGLYQARSAIRTADNCVLVEGNFDVVSLHARGVKNVVAPLGTAFTVEQAQQLRRFCPNLTLLFDGDEAGKRAVRAARDVCQKLELTAKVATLPDGIDPDELSRKEGRAGVERVLSVSRGMLQYLVDCLLDESFSAEDAQAKGALVQRVRELLDSEKDPAARAIEEDRALRLLAERFNMTDARTLQALSARVKAPPQPRKAEGPAAPAVAAPVRARSPMRSQQVELEILGALLDFPELFTSTDAIEAAELLEGDSALALAAMRQSFEHDGLRNPEVVLAKLAPSIHPFALARLSAPQHLKAEDAQAVLSGNVRQLKALVLKRDKKTAVEELERARRTGDFDQQLEVLKQRFDKERRHRVVAPE
ncbi:MAG: DNA primase [Myxococcota bacterium]